MRMLENINCPYLPQEITMQAISATTPDMQKETPILLSIIQTITVGLICPQSLRSDEDAQLSCKLKGE
jgi:hypothetical protein